MLRSRASRVLLGFGFEEELIHFTDGQALGQEIEGAVFSSAMMTVAVGFAAAGEAFNQRGPQEVGKDLYQWIKKKTKKENNKKKMLVIESNKAKENNK